MVFPFLMKSKYQMCEWWNFQFTSSPFRKSTCIDVKNQSILQVRNCTVKCLSAVLYLPFQEAYTHRYRGRHWVWADDDEGRWSWRQKVPQKSSSWSSLWVWFPFIGLLARSSVLMALLKSFPGNVMFPFLPGHLLRCKMNQHGIVRITIFCSNEKWFWIAMKASFIHLECKFSFKLHVVSIIIIINFIRKYLRA